VNPTTTVFVTGGSSVLGSHILASLSPHVRLLVTTHRRPINLPNVKLEFLPDGLERCSEHAARIQAAQIILHLAAVTHASEEERYFSVNTELTKQLLSICKPGQHFIYVSSQSACPDAGAYGHSKWLAEEAVRASGLDYTIIRPAEIYGAKADEGIDALIAFARKTHLLPDFRHHGPVAYAPVSLEEVADFIAAVALHPVRTQGNYVLCADCLYTAADLRAALCGSIRPLVMVPVPVPILRAIARLPLTLPFKPDQLDRLVVCKDYDNSMARRDYGFQPKSFLEYLARQ